MRQPGLQLPPEGAVAWKFTDPTDPARWIFDQAEADEIRSIDPSLISLLNPPDDDTIFDATDEVFDLTDQIVDRCTYAESIEILTIIVNNLTIQRDELLSWTT